MKAWSIHFEQTFGTEKMSDKKAKKLRSLINRRSSVGKSCSFLRFTDQPGTANARLNKLKDQSWTNSNFSEVNREFGIGTAASGLSGREERKTESLLAKRLPDRAGNQWRQLF